MFKYIILDFDNTIYNYDNAFKKSLNITLTKICNEYNLQLDNVINNFNIEKKKFQNYCYNTASNHNKYIQFKKLLEFYDIPLSNLNHYYHIFENEFNNNLKLYDNILDFFNLCKINYIKLYLLTNNICNTQITKLEKLNIIKYFSKIYTSEEFGIEKPDIKLINHILNDINCCKEELVIIGDNFNNDIKYNILNNIYCFWLSNDYKVLSNYCKFSNYNELINLFKIYINESNKLIQLSNYCGQRYDLVQAGGGNISFKMNNLLFIKSSGCNLSEISINKNYVGINYINIKNSLHNENIDKIIKNNIIFLKKYKPSIETTIHTITKLYTLHIHPIQFNFISSRDDCNEIIKKIFINNYCIIDYFTPGIKLTLNTIKKYNNEDIIFLKNHGILITSDNYDSLKILLNNTIDKLENYFKMDLNKYKFVNNISNNLNKIFNKYFVSYLSEDILIDKIINSENLNNIFDTFFPDKFVYCGYKFVFCDNLYKNILDYFNNYNDIPIIFINKLDKYYLYIASFNLKKCRDIESVLKSHFFCYNKNNVLLDSDELLYLKNWDAEKYRKNNII